jgi:uncharacterized protein
MENILTYSGAFFKEFILLSEEMAPYLLIGFLFAGILKVYFPQKYVRKYIGGSNFKSVLNAALLGVPLPLCSCGVLPTGISFYRSGASRGSTVSFLVSTPQTGVDSIIATYAMLGLPLAIIRPVVALLSGVFGGVLVNLSNDKESSENIVGNEDQDGKRSLREMFRYGFVEMMQDITKWLVIGLLVAALLAVLIPADFFTEMVTNEYLAMLLILVASIPLYVCATGSIPIAAVLLMKGLSPGAALVFLMAGPATNAATMAVISNTMGRKTFWLYLASIIGGALIFGTIINELIPRNWIIDHLPKIMHETGHEHGTAWFKISAAIVLALLMINGYVQKMLSRKKVKFESKKYKEIKMKSYKVEGMTCNHCKAAVEKGIRDLDMQADIFADPDSNELRISSDTIDDAKVQKAVEGLGYIYKGISE